MIFGPRKVAWLLFISLLSILNQFTEADSNGLNWVTFIESIELLKNENNHIIKISNTEDGCSRFFSLYFSEFSETDLIGNKKKEILDLVKYNFLSWVKYSSDIQILNSEDHVLTSLEKSQLLEKLKESDFQSLVFTENYVMYNILFIDLNYNGFFNILNLCDNTEFYERVHTIEPKHTFQKLSPIEFPLGSGRSGRILIENGREREFKFDDNDSLEKIISEYSKSRDLFICNNTYNLEYLETLDNFTNDESNLKNDILGFEAAFKLIDTKDVKIIQKNNLRDEKTLDEKVGKETKESGEKSYEEVISEFEQKKNDRELKNIKNLTENGEKELRRRDENTQDTHLVEKRTNFRNRRKCKKVYKSIKNRRFYLDSYPVVSNNVYLVK
ncbi:uncharacterized protein ELE39_003034 [Cryptosporidium sp. chipmunk genotype I]|uniref:uncharacterized protein n=1 Tax=Cryptosporidium sp. chipmunk genotype I TaxID=1280935 RepID=UPI00351A5645|nr:hypothetical protein ELE39_003034 [Cryptosporidium sp. chipmunk genotype I]